MGEISLSRRYLIETFLCLFIAYTLVVYLRKSFTFIAPVISKDLNLEKSDLGLIASTQLSAYTVSKFVSGLIVDHYNARILLAVGLALTALSTILFSLCSSLWLLVLFWFLNGLCQGTAWPASAKILVAWCPASEFGTWWSLLSTSMNVAGTAGPLVAMYVVYHTDWQTSLIAPGVISILTAFLLIFILRNKPSDVGLPNIVHNDKSKTHITRENGTIYDLLSNVTFITTVTTYMLVFLVTSAVSDWGQLYLIQERSRTNMEGSMYMSCLQLGGVIGSVAAGYISDQLVRHCKSSIAARLAVLSLSTAIGCVFVYFFITAITPQSSNWLINTIGFGLGFGFYADVAIFGVVAIECAPKNLTGTAHSIAGLFCNIGAISSGLPLSILARHYGWTGALWILLIVGLVALSALTYTFYRESRTTVTIDKKQQ